MTTNLFFPKGIRRLAKEKTRSREDVVKAQSIIKKILSHLLLAILVLNISVMIPSTQWRCDCDTRPEKISCSCNCPKCVDERGGLLSYCHFSGAGNGGEGKDIFLKKEGCPCGLGHTVLNLPSHTPFITARDTHLFSFFSAYPFRVGSPILLLDDVVSSLDHPG